MNSRQTTNKYFRVIKENNFFVIIYEITKRILLSVYSTYCRFCTLIKLKGNGVEFSTFRTSGIPMIDVKIGGKLIIGKNFSMNNGRYFNKIGRQQPSSFVVTKNSFLIFGDNVGISSSSFFCTKRITVGNNVNCLLYTSPSPRDTR